MTKDLAKLMKKELLDVEPSSILQFDKDVSQIPNIIKLTLGEPDFNTPDHVKQAGQASIAANHSHYTQSPGLPSLRVAAAQFLASKYGTDYDPATQVLTTVGATGAIYSALTAILNPGDEVIIPIPIFPLYIPIVKLNGATPIFVDTSQDGFKLTPEKLANTLATHRDKVKAIVFNYPTNPTGVTYRQSELEAFVAILKQYDIFVISDEIYSELTYGEPHVSLGKLLPEQTLLINGVSKSHAMTGWRIGFIAGPAAVISKINMVHQFTVTSATTMSQEAALEAMQHGLDDGQAMKQEYLQRRDYLVAELNRLGMATAVPAGAFYAFAKIPARFGSDSFAFCRKLAQEAQVALIPGAAFPAGEGYVRISYAASMAKLTEACQRLDKFLAVN